MQYGVCIEMALSDRPFEERLASAASLGFGRVEMWMVNGAFKGSPDALGRLAEKHGVAITNTVIGSPNGSLGGGLTVAANRDQWLERTRMTLDFNREAGIPGAIVCTGNVVDGMDHDAMLDAVVEGLKPTVELAEKAGVTLLLEPLNTTVNHAGYFLSSSRTGADICRRLESPRMKLLFDCYHMQIMEGNLTETIRSEIDVIGHFHAAGVPGRHELFEGEINYPYLVRQIESMGYTGTFGLEYAPTYDHEQSLKHTLEYLRA